MATSSRVFRIARILEHDPRPVDSVDSTTCVCSRCGCFGTQDLVLNSRPAPLHGALVTSPCYGRPMTFQAANYLFLTRTNTRVNSLLLEESCRLVRVSMGVYAIQMFNTYLIRIARDGRWVIAFRGPLTPEFESILAAYSPVQPFVDYERGFWRTQLGDTFFFCPKTELVFDYNGNKLNEHVNS